MASISEYHNRLRARLDALETASKQSPHSRQNTEAGLADDQGDAAQSRRPSSRGSERAASEPLRDGPSAAPRRMAPLAAPPGNTGPVHRQPIPEYRDLPHYFNALRARMKLLGVPPAPPTQQQGEGLGEYLDDLRNRIGEMEQVATGAEAPPTPQPPPTPPVVYAPPERPRPRPQLTWHRPYQPPPPPRLTWWQRMFPFLRKTPATAVGGLMIDAKTRQGRHEEPEAEKYVLRESFWSRRRLIPLLFLAALLFLFGAFLLAWRMNRDHQLRVFATNTVIRMQSAPSYRAKGIETVTTGSSVTEVQEEFLYVEPNRVKTRYLTTLSQATPSLGTTGGQCSDRDIVVIANARYQRCNDLDAADKGFPDGWFTDQFNLQVLTTPIFQPWQRFGWCRTFETSDEVIMIEGVPTTAYSCRVPAQREIAWMTGDTMKTITDPYVLTDEGRQAFVDQGGVDIILWVRQTDNYVGRFRMQRTIPGKSQTTIQIQDYVYSDFGVVPSIRPPADDSAADSSGGSGSEQSGGSAGDANPSLGTNVAPLGIASVAGMVFNIEVADTEAKLREGLSGRDTLPPNEGMLFVFDREFRPTFWMKGVSIPLDIVFLDKDRRIVDIKRDAQPQPGVPDDQLTRYSPKQPAQYVLELLGGTTQALGIEEGLEVTFR